MKDSSRKVQKVGAELKIIVFAVIFFLCSVIPHSSFGATYYAIANGNWTDNTTWSLTSGGSAVGAGIYPTSTDNVDFGQKTVTLTANAACSNLENYGGTGTFALGNYNVSVSGNITIDPAAPTFTSTGGYIILNGTTQTILLNSANITIPNLELANGTQVTQEYQGSITVTGNLTSQGTGSTYIEDTWGGWSSGELIATGVVNAPGTTFTVTNPVNPTAIDFSGSSSNPIIVGGVILSVNTTITFGANNVSTSTAFNKSAGTIISGTITVVSLPIELLDFKALQGNRIVTLSWSTATETNNDFFIVERSTDGVTWNEVHICNGAGTSTIAHSYSFIDYETQMGTVYYRLKQTDINGNFTYSDIISVSSNTQMAIKVFPNPFDGKTLYISGLHAETDIQLLNEFGSVVYSTNIKVDGNMTVYLEFDEKLPLGTYFIKCVSTTQLFTEKLMVK